MYVVEKKEFYVSDDTGDAGILAYTVFPGTALVYSSIHVDRFGLGARKEGSYIEIHYCREGRIEKTLNGDHLCLMPGDLSVTIRTRETREFNFPLRHYHGIIITMDIDAVPECFAQLLEDACVEPLEVAKKLCREKKFFVLRGEARVNHIFSELYSPPEEGKIGYFRVKLLELFLLLNGIDAAEYETGETLALRPKIQIAKQAADYLAEHMNQRVTIPELAKRFNVSDSYLKNAFKEAFGVPVYSYVRLQKMQLAAKWLADSDRPIMEIANECGYGNGSKFTAAFRDVMGETPSDYRKLHTGRSD